MTSSDGIQGRLSEAWAFLTGEPQEFLQVVPPALGSVGETDHVALLPIRVDESIEGACRLVIRRDQAARVASYLFGLEVQDLSEADLHDAVLEACNVLGSCLAQRLEKAERVSIGCPSLAAEAPQGLFTHSHFCPVTLNEPRLDLLTGAPLVPREDA
jgi:hypothetical protein